MSILNRAKTKRVILARARAQRGHEFTRVSKEFLDRLEVYLINRIDQELHQHPSKGTTLK